MHGSLLNDIHLVAKDPLKLNKHLFKNPEHYFILFLTIKQLLLTSEC